jgi:hypothetical protein
VGQSPNRGRSPILISITTARQSRASHQAAEPDRQFHDPSGKASRKEAFASYDYVH